MSSFIQYDVESLIADYGDWLKQETVVHSLGEWKEVTVPFLDRSNDDICFYAKFDEHSMFFTDDGFTIENLLQTGIPLTASRMMRLRQIVERFGAQIDESCNITLRASKNYPEVMHRYIQALTDVNAVQSASTKQVSGYFAEDVRKFLDDLSVYYTSDVSVRGTSKYEHHFDFIFQRSQNHPTRFCQAPNTFDKDTVKTVMWGWEDTRQTEQRRNSKLIIIGDDREERLQATAREAFESCGVTVIPYSELGERAPVELAA